MLPQVSLSMTFDCCSNCPVHLVGTRSTVAESLVEVRAQVCAAFGFSAEDGDDVCSLPSIDAGDNNLKPNHLKSIYCKILQAAFRQSS